MAANHKYAHIPNVRERRAEQRAKEAEAGPVEPEQIRDNVVEVEDADEANAGAQSEPQASDSADARAEAVAETDTQGFEKPITLGGIDG